MSFWVMTYGAWYEQESALAAIEYACGAFDNERYGYSHCDIFLGVAEELKALYPAESVYRIGQ